MSDEISIPVTCPKCGTELLGPEGKAELEPNDMLSCPTHGEIGSLDEIGRAAAKATGDAVADMLKRAGFDVKKD
ncbi:MAG: hypothetical protein ACHQF3_00130 [Alphaproteobacteria bacterium]